MHIAGPSKSTRRENRAQSRNVLHVNTRNACIDKHRSDTTPVSKQETLSITLDANAKMKLSPGKKADTIQDNQKYQCSKNYDT